MDNSNAQRRISLGNVSLGSVSSPQPGLALRCSFRQERNHRKHVESGALFCDLHALNLEYLSMLTAASHRAADSFGVRGLPDTVSRSLGMLSDTARRAIAECPFGLFDLAFDDAARWRSPLSFSTRPSASRSESSARKSEFARAILFFAWHAVHVDVMFARFALGMCDETAKQLFSLSVTNVTCIAASASEWLAPRWPNNVCFWPDLIRFATANADPQLHAAKLLGCQLLAVGRTPPTSAKASIIGAVSNLQRRSAQSGERSRNNDQPLNIV